MRIMEPDELEMAMASLGERWFGQDRLTDAQMARALRLTGNGAESVRNYRRGKDPISGPISVAVEAMLDGATPRDGLHYIERG